jgi:hypothetical protein
MWCRQTLTSAALVSLLFLSCSTDGAKRPTAAPSPRSTTSSDSAPVVPGPARTLLYLDGRDLRSLDLETGRDRLLDRAPSTDAEATSDGSVIAYVVSSSPTPGDEDFIATPEVRVVEVESGASSTVGPGFSPLWTRDGTRLAMLVPTEVRECEGEACAGTVSAVVADRATGERATVVDAGSMSLLGWWGDRLLVGLQDPPSVIAVSIDGSIERLDLAPNEVWGPAPDGTNLLVVDGNFARFVAPGAPKGVSVPLEGLVLGEGTWAPDAGVVAAVGLRPRGSELVLVEPESSGLERVGGSEGAQGQVVWAPDSASFVFTRSTGGRAFRLEAVHCSLQGLRCEKLFSWGRGVRLLALIP